MKSKSQSEQMEQMAGDAPEYWETHNGIKIYERDGYYSAFLYSKEKDKYISLARKDLELVRAEINDIVAFNYYKVLFQISQDYDFDFEDNIHDLPCAIHEGMINKISKKP